MNEKRTAREILAVPLGIVVGVGWAASLVMGLITNSFVGLEITTPVMLLLSGYVFGVQIVRSAKNEQQ